MAAVPLSNSQSRPSTNTTRSKGTAPQEHSVMFRQPIKRYVHQTRLNKTVEGEKWYLNLVVSTLGKVELCQVDVWSRPWLKDGDAFLVTRDPDCTEGTGFPVVVNINNTEVQKALSFAECTFNNDSDSPVLWKAVSIGLVTSQIVSGTLFKFTDVVFSPTNCSKKTTHSLTPGCVPTKDVTCPACYFDVWEGWKQPLYKMNNSYCEAMFVKS
ncbi:uncharacterized protein LOC131930712 [Physella acuta]|uniref:uncharacterized protein LOC131930712 n=1 Tax=Physella acuta TaxID=109671 RepID=UPI0027DC984F|nr:uncharacterized protein LOC131930712 [Physella acuta]